MTFMPIYEYRCAGCDCAFETFVRSGQDGDAQCPSCHGTRLRREMSVFAARGSTANGAAAAAEAIASNGGGRITGGCCGGGCGCH
jgi:putative FmdB family regulatory protein